MLSFIGSTPTGGNGVFDPTFALPPQSATNDLDQAIQISADRSLMFAVNGGSNSVAVFHIYRNGSLEPVFGSPFPSGGTDPVSVGLKGDILAVANKDDDPLQNPFPFMPNYTSFRVGDDGVLTPIPDSSVSVAYFSSPTQVLPARVGDLFFASDTQGELLHAFRVDDGRLLQNPPVAAPSSLFGGTAPLCHLGGPGSPASPCPHLIIGMQVHPTKPVLYVGFTTAPRSDTPTTGNVGLLGVYRYESDGEDRGKVSFIRAAANSGNGLCWILLNREGTRIYTVNTFDNSVSVYDSTEPLNPVEVQHLQMVANTGFPTMLALDRSEKFLYVISERAAPFSQVFSNAIHVLKVASDGKLTEVAGSPTSLAPFITGNNGITTVQGIAVY
jgi:6-phosphogluconolactonase (cycloisomerase 2 family)